MIYLTEKSVQGVEIEMNLPQNDQKTIRGVPINIYCYNLEFNVTISYLSFVAYIYRQSQAFADIRGGHSQFNIDIRSDSVPIALT